MSPSVDVATSSGPQPPRSSMNWADDVEDDVSPDVPKVEEKDEGNGVKVIVEYRTNPEGKRVKITRRIRRTLIKTTVNEAEAERKTWTKFGAEKNRPSGPHSSTTTIGENVQLKLSAGNKKAEPEPDAMDSMRAQLANKKIVCRLCKGDHFTTKCPYKDTLEAIPGAADTPEGEGSLTPAAADPSNPAVAASAAAGGAGGKYVPPSMRGGGNRTGERMGGPGLNRDDLPTLRVTNLSEDADDDDLRELFSRFGRVVRVYVGRDRETGICKGYAFVSFESREDADRARQRVDGKGYDNLILSVGWSVPRGERPGGA
ncbi:translation initiation factor 3, RNA-binding subunit [Microstroma glucosiphilum]|uniref:Eukaryotic translation initiation factor 3 subunit G n=1 Tax=Pseudomicrostroma glucosiphilum TaxID=1684307 RepID=A0A316UCU5_9BASI|nr:translation initiation factor 3, RNA-binding subunit [Pseudomicrostroma glucosiphilum]PWN23057.1 translation initiation factor 3, RNA-binding subunit [Pseudomicrostroma glucosiphilum]